MGNHLCLNSEETSWVGVMESRVLTFSRQGKCGARVIVISESS